VSQISLLLAGMLSFLQTFCSQFRPVVKVLPVEPRTACWRQISLTGAQTMPGMLPCWVAWFSREVSCLLQEWVPEDGQDQGL
jgi:hypothetical protein